MTALSELHSYAELAEMFSDHLGEAVSERRVRDWAREYKWPRVEVGRAVRFTDEHIAEIIARHTIAGGSSQPTKPVLIAGQTQRSARRSS